MRPHNEIVFESDIIRDLTSSPVSLFSKPYLEGNSDHYNAELGLYKEDIIQYISITQPDEYEKLIQKQGKEVGEDHLAKEVASSDFLGCDRKNSYDCKLKIRLTVLTHYDTIEL
jgi:hypothetical protein